MKSTQNLPQRLKELRNQHHYSQEDLAEKLNVTRQAVSRWENGKAVPDIDNLLLLAELYNVPLDYMLDEKIYDRNSENSETDLQKESSIMEIMVCSAILILSSSLPIVDIPIAIVVLLWLIQNKRNYKLIYFLCILCLFTGIEDIYVIYNHVKPIYEGSFVFIR